MENIREYQQLLKDILLETIKNKILTSPKLLLHEAFY